MLLLVAHANAQHVLETADICVGGIGFSPGNPLRGQVVHINVSIANTGGFTADNVNVSLMIDGGILTSLTTRIPQHSTSVVRFNASFTAGRHMVAVAATLPEGMRDGDTSNNIMSEVVWARDFWPVFRHDAGRSGAPDVSDPLGGLARQASVWREIRPKDYGLIWSYNSGHPIFSSPLAVDLDGNDDGGLEVVFVSSDGTAYALHDGGNPYWEYHSNSPVHSSPAAADLDGDGVL